MYVRNVLYKYCPGEFGMFELFEKNWELVGSKMMCQFIKKIDLYMCSLGKFGMNLLCDNRLNCYKPINFCHGIYEIKILFNCCPGNFGNDLVCKKNVQILRANVKFY